MYKQSSKQFFLSLGKAFKESTIGGKSKAKKITGDFMLDSRSKASDAFPDLSKSLPKRVHRARVKTPESMQAKGIKNIDEVDDLLGVQVYSKSPGRDIGGVLKAFDGKPAVKKLNRKGYKGVNVKGKYKGVPTEVQLSPGRISNAGQILQHNAYKPPANFTDWDVKASDRLGSFLVDRTSKEWKKFLT